MESFRSKLTPKLLMGLSDTSTRHPAMLMAVKLKELSLRSVPTANTSVLSVLSLSLLADIHRSMSVKQFSSLVHSCRVVSRFAGSDMDK